MSAMNSLKHKKSVERQAGKASFSETAGTQRNENAAVAFVKYVNEKLLEYIRFTDAKAGAVFFIAGAMLGFLFRELSTPQFTNLIQVKDLLKGLLSLSAALVDAGAMGFGLWTVFPRVTKNPPGLCSSPISGLIFWKHMLAKFKDGEEYAAAISKLDREQPETWQVKALATDSYALAKIAHHKYGRLRLAMVLTGIGAVLTFARAIFF